MRSAESSHRRLWEWIVTRRSMVGVVVSVALLSGCGVFDRYRSDDPLVHAASRCDVETVSELLDAGGDPDRRIGGFSALFSAAGGSLAGPGGEGCLETLQLLVGAGGDVTRTQEGGSVFTNVALGQGDPAIVAYLVDHGADPCTPLPEDEIRRSGVESVVEIARKEGTPEVAAALEQAVADCE